MSKQLTVRCLFIVTKLIRQGLMAFILMILSSPVFALSEEHRAILSRPIVQSFDRNDVGSEGYSALTPKDAIYDVSNALMQLSLELGSRPINPVLQNFVEVNKSKIAYWLYYFLSSENHVSAAVELIKGGDFRYMKSMAQAFGIFERVLSKNFLQTAFRSMRASSYRTFFGEDVAFPHSTVAFSILKALYVEDSPANQIQKLAEWPSIESAITRSGISESEVSLFIDFHQQGRLSILDVFKLSLRDYVYYRLSYLGGYSSTYVDQESPAAINKVTPRWFNIALNLVGTEQFMAAIKQSLLAQHQAYVGLPVGTFEEGLFRWAILAAPDAIRESLVDFYVEMALRGKDWSKWRTDLTGLSRAQGPSGIQYVEQMMHEAVLQKITKAMETEAYKTIWDYFIHKEWITPKQAGQLQKLLNPLYLREYKAIEGRYESTMQEIRDKAANPAKVGVRAFLSGGRFGRDAVVDVAGEELKARILRDDDLQRLTWSFEANNPLGVEDRIRLLAVLRLLADKKNKITFWKESKMGEFELVRKTDAVISHALAVRCVGVL